MFDYWLWDSVLPEWFCEEQIKNINWEKKEDGKVGQYGEYVVNKEKRITDIADSRFGRDRLRQKRAAQGRRCGEQGREAAFRAIQGG